MTASDLKSYIVKENLTEKLLELIGCTYIREDGEFFRCARPKGDNRNGCAINKNTLSVTIFTPHDGSGDIYNLVCATYNIDFVESIKKIKQLLGIKNVDFDNDFPTVKSNPADCLLKYKNRNFKSKDIKYYSDEILDRYINLPNMMWLKEGISVKTQAKYNIGYDLKSNRITIPHFALDQEQGKYMGVVGRTIYNDYDVWGINKYLSLVEFPKSYSIYGYIQNYIHIQKKKYCVVFESEKSVLKRDSNSDFTAVAIGGKDISNYQVKMLIALNVDIILALDEGVGLEFIKMQCQKFSGCRNIYYIYDTENILKEKQSPADLSNEKYNYLLNNKVKYINLSNQIKPTVQ